jgi:hypothetical protein
MDDEEKTLFIMPFGIFCYTKMAFGLKNGGRAHIRSAYTPSWKIRFGETSNLKHYFLVHTVRDMSDRPLTHVLQSKEATGRIA